MKLHTRLPNEMHCDPLPHRQRAVALTRPLGDEPRPDLRSVRCRRLTSAAGPGRRADRSTTPEITARFVLMDVIVETGCLSPI